MLFNAVALSLVAFASPALAFVGGNQLLDFNPPVTSPSGGEMWLAGGTYSVSWNQTLPPTVDVSTISQTANFVLGFQNSTGNNLQWELATNVPLYAPNPNTVSVTLPKDLQLGSSYLIALIGSSGDTSGLFTVLPSLFAKGKRGPLKATVAEKRRIEEAADN